VTERIEARLEREWRALIEGIATSTASPLDRPPGRRQAVSRVALLAQLEEVREELRSLRRAIDQETAARFANAEWTLKDLLAHLASWAREFRSEIETASRIASFDYAIPFAMSVLGPTEWNEREVRARAERSLEEIFRELEEETERLESLVAGFEEGALYRPVPFPLAPSGSPKERMSAPPAFVIAGKCLHDRYHFAQIRKLLARLRE
jgi:uncharacterized damage-inducible protein DinB